MANVFPRNQEFEELFPHIANYKKPRDLRDPEESDHSESDVDDQDEFEYPRDWRRMPTPMLDKPDVVWLYTDVNIARQSESLIRQKAIKAIDRLFADHGIYPIQSADSRRADVRKMIRDGRRFALLLDIMSTRRVILTGSPHDLATELYRYVEEAYPIFCTFMFVGITDNGSKRVARDIFNLDPVTGTKKIGFGSIDNEHLFVVHPKGNEADDMRKRRSVEQKLKEEEDRKRRSTPKYVPPPPPEWLTALESRAASRATDSRSQARSPVLLHQCERCWLFGSKFRAVAQRSRSRPHSQQNSTPPVKTESTPLQLKPHAEWDRPGDFVLSPQTQQQRAGGEKRDQRVPPIEPHEAKKETPHLAMKTVVTQIARRHNLTQAKNSALMKLWAKPKPNEDFEEDSD